VIWGKNATHKNGTWQKINTLYTMARTTQEPCSAMNGIQLRDAFRAI
jgi:hypothetical protein